MSVYFSFLPQVNYPTTDGSPYETLSVTNIFFKQRILDNFINNTLVYYPYKISGEDRPDTVAFNYYGSVKYTWLLLLANNIQDVFHDWPLTQKNLLSLLKTKYGSIKNSKDAIHEYRQIVRQETSTQKEYSIVIDGTTYNSLSVSERKIVSKYDYEEALNDIKRDIKVIDRTYVESIYREAQRKFK